MVAMQKLLRNVDGNTITVYYEPGNQAGFVSGVDLSGEADGFNPECPLLLLIPVMYLPLP